MIVGLFSGLKFKQAEITCFNNGFLTAKIGKEEVAFITLRRSLASLAMNGYVLVAMKKSVTPSAQMSDFMLSISGDMKRSVPL